MIGLANTGKRKTKLTGVLLFSYQLFSPPTLYMVKLRKWRLFLQISEGMVGNKGYLR